MARLPLWAWIGNAAAALGGAWGSVTLRASDVGCSRQTVYKHGRLVAHAVHEAQAASPRRAELLSELARLRWENQQLWDWLDQTIEFPQERQEEFAATATALGLSVTQVRLLLEIVLRKRCPSRSTLAQWIGTWARKATEVLRLLDQPCRPLVRMLCLDDIFCRRVRGRMPLPSLSD